MTIRELRKLIYIYVYIYIYTYIYMHMYVAIVNNILKWCLIRINPGLKTIIILQLLFGQCKKETKKIGGLSKSGDFKLSWLNKIHEDSKIVVNVKWYNLFQLEYLKHKTLGKKRKVL